MSAETGRLDDAVAALMRKSRISAITTALIAVGLGIGFAFLSYEVYEKRQELNALNAQEADLEQQIAAKKLELANATTAAAQTSVAAFKEQLTAAASNAAPEARTTLAAVIARAQVAQTASGAGRLVYLQYADPTSLVAMKAMQAALAGQNFVAPGIERTDPVHFDPKTPNLVKYFHEEDAAIAQAIARIAGSVLAKTCPNLPSALVPAVFAPVPDPGQAPQLEVWIGSACGDRAGIVPALKAMGSLTGAITTVVTPLGVKPGPRRPK